MAKVAGSLIGYITRADLGICQAGTATVLTSTLPWHVRYSGFRGTLPEINRIFTHIIGASWRVRESGGIACLARSSTSEPVHEDIWREPATQELFAVELSGTIRTGIECFGISGSFGSSLGVFSISSVNAKATVHLI
jgi:hypothetical protein